VLHLKLEPKQFRSVFLNILMPQSYSLVVYAV